MLKLGMARVIPSFTLLILGCLFGFSLAQSSSDTTTQTQESMVQLDLEQARALPKMPNEPTVTGRKPLIPRYGNAPSALLKA